MTLQFLNFLRISVSLPLHFNGEFLIMHEISEKAKARGLSSEISKCLLNEE